MLKRRRLLMISPHGYVAAHPELGRPDTGGQVVYVLELSKHIARMGWDVDILTRQFEGLAEEELAAPGVRILRAACGGSDFIPKERLHESLPEFIANADKLISAQNLPYRAINSHYWDGGLVGQSLSKRLGLRHLHTPHSLGAWKRDQMQGDAQTMERTYNFRIRIDSERETYRRSDLVIATSAEQRALMERPEYGVERAKVRILPPGYDERRFFPVSAAARRNECRKLEFGPRAVLALGRIAENKGYDLLLKAMATVLDRVPDAELVLAIGAKNPPPAEMKQIAALKELARRLQIERQVHFLDYIPDDVLPEFYRACRVFCLCSRYEPFGMTAIEAMACGTPTVVTTRGGLHEEISWGRDAVGADPEDTVGLGIEIANVLLHEDHWARLSRAGAALALRKFAWSGIAERFLSLAMRRQPAEPNVPRGIKTDDLNLRHSPPRPISQVPI